MKHFTFCIAILTLSINCSAQFIDNGFNEQRLKMRVKQLDEFMERFNYEKDIEGNPISDQNNIEKRKQYVFSLFNEEIFNKPNDTLINRLNDFLDKTVNKRNSVFIKFEDKNWFAQVNCKVSYNGQLKDLLLILKSEQVKKYEYKWIIADAKASFLSLKPSKKNPGLMISPVENELNFMSLPDICENSKDVINYSPKHYQAEQLTVFFTLIYSGQLKINKVSLVKYHFLQVPNYVFTVSHFERESDNVGWLISDVVEINNEDKNKYIQTLKL